MTQIISLPQLAWHDISEFKVALPDSWQVAVCDMAGANLPAMKPEEIRAALDNPIGIDPIRKLARNRQEVAIIFDDMSRVTRVAQIVPYILEALAEAGIPDRKIRFICALGCHGTMNRLDFVKKLGEEALSRFPVYNHNAFGNVIDVGTTRHGTRVFVNAEVMKCDLKIAIGSIVPHIFAGYGGGAKIIMPGITSLETTRAFHSLLNKIKEEYPDRPIGIGSDKDNPLRLDMEDAARLVGLDMKIDCIVNKWGETVSVYAGALEPAYAAGVEEAKRHYCTPKSEDNDIVIANTFAKVNESEGGLITALPAVSQRGGDVVLICNVPEGHVTHYLMGPWGNITEGGLQLKIKLPPNVNHIIILNKYFDLASVAYFDNPEKVLLMDSWENTLQFLQRYHKEDTKVAIYPNSEIQYCT